MSRKYTRTTKINDFNDIGDNKTGTITTTLELNQQQCSPIGDLNGNDNVDVVCKSESPPSPPPSSCENGKKTCIYYCECGDESHQSPVELFDSDDDDNTINNNFTCIRYDYDNKTKENRVNCEETPTIYRHTKPLFTYIKESRQQQRINNELKRFDYHKSNGTIPLFNNNGKRKINENELRSPETHKNEFCTYLKLMKPADQQNDSNLLRNRRSVRVKNLKNDRKPDRIETNSNVNQYLPLPPIEVYNQQIDFEYAIVDVINNQRIVENEQTIQQKDDLKKKRLLRERVQRNKLNWRRINSLRSTGHLKDVSLDQLMRRNRLKRRYRREKREKLNQSIDTTTEMERCEIITIFTVNSDDDNGDDNNNAIVDESDKSMDVGNLNDQQYKELLNDLIGVSMDTKFDQSPDNLKDLINFEHDYAENDEQESVESSDSTSDLDDDNQHVNNVNVIETEILINGSDNDSTILKKRGNRNNVQEQSNHSIKISETNGTIIYTKYMNNYLIVVQQDLISLWTQSQLGSILNSQIMWIPNGQIKRLILNNNNNNNHNYIKQKVTTNCIISTETTFAYIELWIKEHKSDIRKLPYCDIFATIYFWQHRQNGLDKKVLQLENIKGSSEHVQYVVLPNVKLIVVCWYITDDNERKTQIRSYMLANDYQTVASISEFASTEHHILSLHNIEDCDNLVMGCSDNRILLWNIEHGYLIANIDLHDLKPTISTLWVKCDRGFVFVVQQRQDKKLRLIAINGLNNSWKQLHTYGPPPLSNNFNKLTNTYIENGILIAYYKNGVLCWNTQTGKPVLEDIPNNVRYIPSGKYVIIIINERIIIKHALTHFLITAQDL